MDNDRCEEVSTISRNHSHPTSKSNRILVSPPTSHSLHEMNAIEVKSVKRELDAFLSGINQVNCHTLHTFLRIESEARWSVRY